MNNKNYTGRNAFVVGLCGALLIVLSLVVTRPLINAQRATAPAREKTRERAREKDKEKPREQAKEEGSPTPAAMAATPRPQTDEAITRSPAALELGNKIDRAIDESAFASSRWGVYASSLRDGRVLY